MRPNEWTVVECVTRYINESDEARPAGRVEIVPAAAGPAVDTFFIEVRRNGELLPVGARRGISGRTYLVRLSGRQACSPAAHRQRER